MLRLPRSIRIFASTRPVHFNADVDGLVHVVRDKFGVDPFSGHIFCFFNARRNRVKLLVWDRNGFWILYKRLERGRFEWLGGRERWVEIDREKLVMLLEGIDTRTSKFRHNFAREVRISPRGHDDRSEGAAQ